MSSTDLYKNVDGKAHGKWEFLNPWFVFRYHAETLPAHKTSWLTSQVSCCMRLDIWTELMQRVLLTAKSPFNPSFISSIHPTIEFRFTYLSPAVHTSLSSIARRRLLAISFINLRMWLANACRQASYSCTDTSIRRPCPIWKGAENGHRYWPCYCH